MLYTARRGMLVWLVRVLAASAALVFVGIGLLKSVPVVGVLCGVLSIFLLAFFCLFYIPAYFRAYLLRIDDGQVILRTGVFVKKLTSLPIERAVMSTRLASPLMLMFKICSVTLLIPGGRLFLPCVSNEAAEQLASMITPEGGG